MTKIINVGITKTGNSYYFLIPKQYINNCILKKSKEKKYNLLITEIENG